MQKVNKNITFFIGIDKTVALLIKYMEITYVSKKMRETMEIKYMSTKKKH